MPIQAPQWTDYLNCPVCCREFGAPPRSPISLSCGHTLCRHCIKHLHRKQCPFDQTVIQVEPEDMVVNTALLQLVGYTPPAQPYHPPSIQALPERDRQAYDVIVKCMEQLAVYLKYCSNANNNLAGSRLSRPMQRKLVTLLQCTLTDEEGRGRAARAARSLGERTVTEFILLYQNPQQLSANLWAAVRARGCQFLGPAMQEEVLKLVLLALEDGSALSRKVLVMFVVQRLEPHFPQASKTSIGHVVQLLYRASCFKVSKRECDSSLMQLKEEFRTYESLRREHDAQIVQIATEAGLRIAPDQWSALLYGDTAHKSHMQSIIDKLQTPQSFAQSVQEMFIALQRTGDPAELIMLSFSLDRLANIDASPDAKSPTWQQLAEVMTSVKEVVTSLIRHLQIPTIYRPNKQSQSSPQLAVSTPTHGYKAPYCRDSTSRANCIRGHSCTFTHPDDDILDKTLVNQDVSGKRSPLDHTVLPPTSAAAANITITVSNQNQLTDDQDQRNLRFAAPQRPNYTRKPKPRCGGYYPQAGKVVAPQQLPRQPLQMPVAPPQLTSSSFKPYRMQQPVNLQIPKMIPQVRMVPKYPKQDHLELEAIRLTGQPLINGPQGMIPIHPVIHAQNPIDLTNEQMLNSARSPIYDHTQCNDLAPPGYNEPWLCMKANPTVYIPDQCRSTTNDQGTQVNLLNNPAVMDLMNKAPLPLPTSGVPPPWTSFDLSVFDPLQQKSSNLENNNPINRGYNEPSTSSDWRVVGARDKTADEELNSNDGSDDVNPSLVSAWRVEEETAGSNDDSDVRQLEERLQALESQFDTEYEGTD